MSEAASAEKPAKNQGNEGSSHCSNGEERRQDSRKDRHRIPWKEQGFALFRRDDWKFVLDEHNAPAAAPRLLADAGQRVMPGVLTVKPPQPQDCRLVQHIAVEDILQEAVDQAEREKRRASFPGRGKELVRPDARGQQPQRGAQGGERDRHGEQEARQVELLGFGPGRRS